MSELRVVADFDDGLVRQVARLHLKAISYSSFITDFGEGFLFELYRALLEMRLGFLIVALDGTRLEGFVLGTDGSNLNQAVLRRPWAFMPSMLPAVLRKPSLVPKIIAAAFYGDKTLGITDLRAELVAIAVEESTRSRGLGKNLVLALDSEMRARGVTRYKVTTHTDMTRANKFYLANGFQLEGAFPLAGFTWNVYSRRIPG